MLAEVPDDKRGVGSAKSEGIGQEGIEVAGHPFGQDHQFGGVFVRVLEVDVGADEIVLHHQDRVDDLAGACHPHLVAGLALGAGDRNALVADDGVDGLGFVGVAHVGGSGVCVDVADLVEAQARLADGTLQGTAGTVDIGVGDVLTVAREAVAQYLGNDGRAPADGRFVAFQDDRGGTTARDQAVAVAVEGPAGLFRGVFAGGESGNAVERTGSGCIDFLRTSAGRCG